LVIGLSFTVTAQRVLSTAGDSLGFPYSASFIGMVPLAKAAPRRSGIGYMDLANDAIDGGYTLDDSGDLATHTGLASLRKRILRRIATPKGAFVWMKDYGVGIDPKKPMTVNRMMALKVDLRSQIKLEPEVADVSSTISKDPRSFVQVSLSVRTKAGAVFGLNLGVSQQGTISVG
jgi:hypothetical protein